MPAGYIDGRTVSTYFGLPKEMEDVNSGAKTKSFFVGF
jgi:hypothetical protein